MFKSHNLLICFGLAIVVALPCTLTAQDEPAAGEAAAGGSKLKPTVVVQEEMDEGSLIEKVSYFMGYNLMKNFMQQGQDFDKEMLYKGMKAAVEGPDQKSYVAGYQIMKRLQDQGGDLTLEKMYEGMNLASEGKEHGMSSEEVQAMMGSFQKVIMKRRTEKLEMEANKNAAATKEYMAKNALNPAVKSLPNVVQYEVLVPGTGPSPTKEQIAKIDYHGTLFDGTVFDSTIKHPSGRPPKPAQLTVGRFVPGFSSVLQAMKVGGKWKVCIPGELAYGARGSGNNIGPNQGLIFEVSLLEIVEPPAKKAAPPVRVKPPAQIKPAPSSKPAPGATPAPSK